MKKEFIPKYLASSIFDIDFNKVKELGYKYVLVDLDNTLASPYVYEPDEKVINLTNKIKELGLTMIILSNNHQERVVKFAKPLNVLAFYDLKKPRTKRVKVHIQENNIDTSKAIWFGDQVMTDVFLANQLNVDVVLVNPLTIKDEPITFIPRMLDKHFRKIINNKKLSKEF